jgi:NAD(P)H-hydrate repair Nnr-like enzyme with NAD(P)H-hydrate dehydratase domain
MGDTLTGMIASLIGQRVEPVLATIAAVHLHGAAGGALAAEGRGPLGITASEVADAARTVLNAALRR